MKAVIMAGGKGVRMRPLTERTPKPLARLCGRPVLEYLFGWLEENGIGECVLALGCLAGRIREHCAANPRRLRVLFHEEQAPLGTAGCVRGALEAFGRDGEPVLVLSADALCAFSLDPVLRTHKKRGSFATLVTARTGDPREYGVVLADGGGRVTGFVEKPAYSQALSETVNTGIYVLSPEAAECLPERGDFAAGYFPEMLAEGRPLYACSLEGYWRDVGGLRAYLDAQRDLLDGLARPLPRTASPKGNYILRPPVWIGKNVRIGEKAVVGPWAVLDEGSAVGAGAEVTGSVLLPGARLGARAAARESVICAGAEIGAGARLSGCAVGERASVGSRARLCPGTRTEGGSRIREGAVLEAGTPAVFDDDGFRGTDGAEVTPELAVRLGGALGAAAWTIMQAAREGRPGEGTSGKCTVGVACAGTRLCRVLADALTAGARGAGASVMDFGNAFEALFHFGMRSGALPLGVYIGGGERVAIRILESAGLPASRAAERAVEQSLQGSPGGAGLACGSRMELSGIGTIYATELLRMAPEGLEGVRACAVSENPAVERMLSSALTRLGCTEDPEGVRLEVSPDGMRLAMSQGAVRMGRHRTVAAYGRLLFARGEDLAVENDFPRALDAWAEQQGCRVRRYLLCPADGGDAQGRMLAKRQCARDGLMLGLTLLADMRRRGVTLAELDREIPAFAVREEDLALTIPPGRILSRLEGERTGEGVVLREDSRGVVLVRARKSGEALRLFAEAGNWETAAELCADVSRRLKEMMGEA